MIPSLALLSLALLISLLRLHYYDWPPNRDVTLYATIAHELVLGKQLYVDVWDLKPPAVFATYWMSERVFGHGPLGLYVLNLLPALLVLAGLYRAGIAAGLGASAGLWAAVFWAALSGDVLFQMQDPNTEAFMNALAVWGFVLFLPSGNPRSLGRAVVLGCLFALASFYKQVIISIPAALAAAQIVFPPPEVGRRRVVAQMLIITVVGCLGWAVLAAFFAVTGRFENFHETLFVLGPAYAGHPLFNLFRGFTLGPVLGGAWAARAAVPLCMLMASVGWIAWDRKRRRIWVLLLAYFLGAFAAVCLPGKFYAHYFQLLLPPLALAAGWAIVVLRRELPRRIRWAPVFLAALLLLGIVYREQVYYRSTPEELLPGSYAELYLTTKKLGLNLGEILQPEETLFQWGEESGLYYYSRKRPTSTLLCWPLLSRKFGEGFTSRTLDELEAEPPDLFIAARYFIDWRPDHPVLQWMKPRYERVEVGDARTDRYFVLWVRMGSDLEARSVDWTGSL